MEEREITIVKGGRETPFSRGILAQTLAQAGAGPELAHQIASEVRAELLAEQLYTVEEEEVLARVRNKLITKDALVVSTLAADVARRLNIQSVVGTDSIREVLRRAISPDLLPLLHKSSYEIKREDLRVPVEEDEMVLYGFRQQASQVALGVEAIVDRGLKEGTNLVVEGVHLVPEMILN